MGPDMAELSELNLHEDLEVVFRAADPEYGAAVEATVKELRR